MPRRYVLTLIMIGRLLEVAKPQAERLIEQARAQSERVLVYTYPDWSNQSLEAIARQFGLHLREPVSEMAALLEEFHSVGDRFVVD